MIRNILLVIMVSVTSLASAQSDDVLNPFRKYRVEVVAENLRAPWSILFLPDGSMLFSERIGKVGLIDKNGSLSEKPVLVLDDVVQDVKLGLLGLAAHPDFDSNHYVYIAYGYREGQNSFVRINRYVFKDQQLVDPHAILESIPAAFNHSGCRMRFGPDRKLYITTGDANVPNQAQDLSSLAGKILRLNPDGSVPADNPFVNQSSARPEIWSYGHRNPQGLDFQPGSSLLFSSEHGPRGGDEINIVEKGGNYGWPVIHHTLSREGMRSPLLEFSPSIAPGSGMFYQGSAFPELTGDFLVGCLRGECILRIKLNGRTVIGYERLLHRQYGRIRDVAQSPEGYIYFTTSQFDPPEGSPRERYDQILRIVPSERSAESPQSKEIPSAEAPDGSALGLYNEYCASCHGPGMAGGLHSSLIDGKWAYGGDMESITRSIAKGIPDTEMPGSDDLLKPAEIDSIVRLIQQLESQNLSRDNQ